MKNIGLTATRRRSTPTNVAILHARSAREIAQLTGFWVKNVISHQDVVSVLNRSKVSFVLVGLYGLMAWIKETRATQDMDVIVAAKHHKKAVQALLRAFPHLEVDDQEVVARLRNPETGTVVIDVMKPNLSYRAAFKHTHAVKSWGQSYRIPTLEMALAMKFAPLVSLVRQDEDNYQDAPDFILMVKANPEIDLTKLESRGELVYPGGGKETLEMVRKVRAGEKLTIL